MDGGRLRFSWIPFKPQLGNLLKSILPNNIIVLILQGKLRGKKWIISSGNIEMALGSYEFEERILFEKMISKSSVVYDIGAHVGFYTLLASELVGRNGKVFSFEPVSLNLYYLRRHLEINHCSNVTIIEAAISDKSGSSSFSENSNFKGRLSRDGDLIVNTISIDDLIMKDKMPYPNYIKIDVEGAELLVLKGAKSCLSNYSPKIFLETHSQIVPNIHKECCNFLKSLEYTIKPITGNSSHITRKILAYKKGL